MITLYELHWSHYCEKVRLALAYMGLRWRAVGIDAFRKRELRDYPLPEYLPNRLVPAIHDHRTGVFLMDSTPILRYLAQTYPDAPTLYPGGAPERAAIDAKLLELDSELGIPARRFGYIQLILECPGVLTDLLLAHRAHGFFLLPGIRGLAARFLGMLLSQRYEFHRAESIGLYEALERYLLRLADELKTRAFVVGEMFSAADITLATHLRPLTIVPFFAEHPGLKDLFIRHQRVIARLGGADTLPYQAAIAEARVRRPPVRRRLRAGSASMSFASAGDVAANDHRPVWTLGMWAMPFHYFYGIRRNKVRQAVADATVR